jgi:hypothetical protein
MLDLNYSSATALPLKSLIRQISKGEIFIVKRSCCIVLDDNHTSKLRVLNFSDFFIIDRNRYYLITLLNLMSTDTFFDCRKIREMFNSLCDSERENSILYAHEAHRISELPLNY